MTGRRRVAASLRRGLNAHRLLCAASRLSAGVEGSEPPASSIWRSSPDDVTSEPWPVTYVRTPRPPSLRHPAGVPHGRLRRGPQDPPPLPRLVAPVALRPRRHVHTRLRSQGDPPKVGAFLLRSSPAHGFGRTTRARHTGAAPRSFIGSDCSLPRFPRRRTDRFGRPGWFVPRAERPIIRAQGRPILSQEATGAPKYHLASSAVASVAAREGHS
jgi:hypothetical protein